MIGLAQRDGRRGIHCPVKATNCWDGGVWAEGSSAYSFEMQIRRDYAYRSPNGFLCDVFPADSRFAPLHGRRTHLPAIFGACPAWCPGFCPFGDQLRGVMPSGVARGRGIGSRQHGPGHEVRSEISGPAQDRKEARLLRLSGPGEVAADSAKLAIQWRREEPGSRHRCTDWLPGHHRAQPGSVRHHFESEKGGAIRPPISGQLRSWGRQLRPRREVP
jgi:hypothetical protein